MEAPRPLQHNAELIKRERVFDTELSLNIRQFVVCETFDHVHEGKIATLKRWKKSWLRKHASST
jgi:hypothetical protein